MITFQFMSWEHTYLLDLVLYFKILLPYGHRHWCDPELNLLACAEVDGYEREPDDAGRVHWEADELGLIEGLGNLSRHNGVERADDHQ